MEGQPSADGGGILEQGPGVCRHVEMGIEDTVECDPVESENQSLGPAGGVLLGHLRGMARYGGCEAADPSLVMSQKTPAQLGIGGCARDRDPDVDPGEGRLLFQESLVGENQFVESVGALTLGVGIDGIDCLAHDGENCLFLGGKQVVEAAGRTPAWSQIALIVVPSRPLPAINDLVASRIRSLVSRPAL